MSERWRTVPGYDGYYEVSDDGRVRSIDRIVSNGKRWEGRVLRASLNNHGYLLVNLSKGNIATQLQVSHLVLAAFIAPRPPGADCAHGNGNQADNNATNLRWATRANNHADKWRHGTMYAGERCHLSKLTADQARRAIEMRQTGMTFKRIGEEFGVTASNIFYIVKGKSWRWALTGERP